ncbi:MAG: TIGR00282 family metallophosphoesterase [Candidatus Saccharimonadales bacterium]
MPSKVRFLYLGDIMGSVGLELVEAELPKLRKRYELDFVLAQAENVSDGKGCTPNDYARLRQAGVDFCTGGNWSLWQKPTQELLADPNQPIIRPANYPVGTAGLGYKYAQTKFGKVLVISLLGQTVGRSSTEHLDNPLKIVDSILEQENHVTRSATVVNFHGDYSSEKVVIGHYLDGRVSAVIGDHWHVPTADARVLPKSTAHITDVGMVGALNSSLGVKTEVIIERWRDGKANPNSLDTSKPWQLNGLLFEVNPRSGKALSAKSLNLLYD